MANLQSPSVRFRQALPTASLSHLMRLASRLPDDIRNTDPSTRQTSLMISAQKGRLDVCTWLMLDEGHEEEEISRDAAGETVLHLSAGNGHVDVLRLYLSEYPFVLDWVNSRGSTALAAASARGQTEAAQILIEHGADIDAPDLLGNTPLHNASTFGRLPLIRLLIDFGCQYDVKNNDGFTPADYSFSFAGVKALEDYVKSHRDALKRSRKHQKLRSEDSEDPRPEAISGTSLSAAMHDSGALDFGEDYDQNGSPVLDNRPFRSDASLTTSTSENRSPSPSLAALVASSTSLVNPPSSATNSSILSPLSIGLRRSTSSSTRSQSDAASPTNGSQQSMEGMRSISPLVPASVTRSRSISSDRPLPPPLMLNSSNATVPNLTITTGDGNHRSRSDSNFSLPSSTSSNPHPQFRPANIFTQSTPSIIFPLPSPTSPNTTGPDRTRAVSITSAPSPLLGCSHTPDKSLPSTPPSTEEKSKERTSRSGSERNSGGFGSGRVARVFGLRRKS